MAADKITGVPKWEIGRKSRNRDMGELLRMVIIDIICYDVGDEFGFASTHIGGRAKLQIGEIVNM